MSTTYPRLMATIVSVASLGASAYLLMQSSHFIKSLPATEPHVVAAPATEESAAGEHGGGHGAPAEGEKVKRGLSTAVTIVTIDELLANVRSVDPTRLHTLGLKLELELFAEENRTVVEQRQSGIKSAIIETAIDSDYAALTTLPGKLYFKEQIISRINTFLNQPIVRDIHFSTFYLQ